MNDTVNPAAASLHEEGDALFDTRLVNAITAQREITHGENHLALRSAFTGIYASLKSIKDPAKQEEALEEDTLGDRVEQVFTHITQDQDMTLKQAFVETLAGAVRDPQAGAYAIKQLAEQKTAKAEQEKAAAMTLLILSGDNRTSGSGLTIEDNSQQHTHQYASDDNSPRARKFRRFVRTGMVVLAAIGGGILLQNKMESDKTNENINVKTGIITNKIDSSTQVILENMNADKNDILIHADSVGTRINSNVIYQGKRTRTMIGNMASDLDSLKDNTRPVVDSLQLNN